MRIEIEISDDKIQGLIQTAQTELKKVAKRYIEEVLDEAGRLESSVHQSSANPEITASIINEAVLYNRRFSYKRTKKRRD